MCVCRCSADTEDSPHLHTAPVTSQDIEGSCGAPAKTHSDNYRALWFQKVHDPLSGEPMHVYKGGYWETKDAGAGWDLCPDIF